MLLFFSISVDHCWLCKSVVLWCDRVLKGIKVNLHVAICADFVASVDTHDSQLSVLLGDSGDGLVSFQTAIKAKGDESGDEMPQR